MSLIDRIRQPADAHPDDLEAQARRRIQEIARCYRHSWDLYAELLQNAVDAINRRFRLLNDPNFYLYDNYRETEDLASDPNYVGKVHVRIDLQTRTIQVADNGTGISGDQLDVFLLPGETDKSIGKEYGCKGYGLTFAGFVSRSIKIETTHFLTPGSRSHIEIDGLFAWLWEESPFPTGPTDTPTETTPSEGEWNTVVTIGMDDGYKSKFPAVAALDEAVNLAAKRERIEYVLRSRTAIGNTRSLFSAPPHVPINVSLEIVDDQGQATSQGIPYSFFHPKDHGEVSDLHYDFSEYASKVNQAGFNRTFKGLFHPLTGVQVGQHSPITVDLGLMAVSTGRLGNIESSLGLAEIESGDIELSYGIYLAIDGMPTGIRIDDWDNRGAHFKRYHVIVDAKLDVSNQLDSGRKGILKHYAKLICEEVISRINSTTIGESSSFRHYAANHLDVSATGGPLPANDFANHLQQQRQEGEQAATNFPDITAKVRQLSSLEYIPDDEQEVVVLFHELLSAGMIKGYRTIYQAQTAAVYDAAYEYEIECTDGNVFPNDPIGIGAGVQKQIHDAGQTSYRHRDRYQGVTSSPELCVEFKLTCSHLLQELRGRTNKEALFIDLVVVWDVGNLDRFPAGSYTIAAVQDNIRVFHATTHRLGLIQEGVGEKPVIVLKDVIERLSDDADA